MSENILILDLEFKVDVLSTTPSDPGVTSGPPEKCYPPEPGEVEWEVNPEQPMAEFITAAVENSIDWQQEIEDQLWEHINSYEPYPSESRHDYD